MATVGDFFWERLHQWGVRCVFGYPGDGINGLLGGLQRFGTDKIRFVQVRHEEMAAFMASAYAKFTGELGVCIATSGPGASHLITGLYDARLDHMPVLAIAGQQARTALGGHYQQELDLVSMFKDVAGAFVQQASTAPQVRHLVDRAVRIALGERRVTALVFPNDLQEAPYEDPPRKHGTLHSGVGYSRPKVVPDDDDLRRAAEVLNAGSKVAFWWAQARCMPRTRSSRLRTGSAPVWPRRYSARPCCPTICLGSLAPSVCSAPSRAGT